MEFINKKPSLITRLRNPSKVHIWTELDGDGDVCIYASRWGERVLLGWFNKRSDGVELTLKCHNKENIPPYIHTVTNNKCENLKVKS